MAIKGCGILKKANLSIVLLLFFTIFGVMIGIHIDTLSGIEDSLQFPFTNTTGIQEVTDLRKANEDMKKRIKELRRNVEALEEERATENIVLQDLKTKVNELKMLAGHQPVMGPGIEIVLESAFEENIAIKMEQKKYLINLINELRASGAEVISINNHRITSRTEVTLAGNHINVNASATAPPYTVRAIGNIEELQRYVNYKTLLFELMQGDGINISIQFNEEVKIPAINKEKPIQFFQIVENAR